jgi:hypothetical protein
MIDAPQVTVLPLLQQEEIAVKSGVSLHKKLKTGDVALGGRRFRSV